MRALQPFAQGEITAFWGRIGIQLGVGKLQKPGLHYSQGVTRLDVPVLGSAAIRVNLMGPLDRLITKLNGEC